MEGDAEMLDGKISEESCAVDGACRKKEGIRSGNNGICPP